MTPFARETLNDLNGHFQGSASFEDLCEWFGATEAVMRDTLRALLDAGLIWKCRGRLTTERPRLKAARSLLRKGWDLADAAIVAGMTPKELDLCLWRDMHRRATSSAGRAAA